MKDFSYYGTISELKDKHPELKYYKSATRKFDGRIFKVGGEIQFRGETLDVDGEMPSATVVAFDHYDHPQYGKVKRAITHYGGGFLFNCFCDIDFLRTVFKRNVLIEKKFKKRKKLK